MKTGKEGSLTDESIAVGNLTLTLCSRQDGITAMRGFEAT